MVKEPDTDQHYGSYLGTSSKIIESAPIAAVSLTEHIPVVLYFHCAVEDIGSRAYFCDS